jgi:hypothetical protein
MRSEFPPIYGSLYITAACRAAVILYAGIFKRTTNYQKGHYRKELITP